MSHKIQYIENLCFIKPLLTLRETPNVSFYMLPNIQENLSGVDLVRHGMGAKSPMIKGDDEHYWYMHTDQEDNLLVHDGFRIVELYSVKHGQKETFKVSADKIEHNGKIIFEGAAMFGWGHQVFHRVASPTGSLSSNYAKRTPNFSLSTNFNIYTLDTKTGVHALKRLGALDQPE